MKKRRLTPTARTGYSIRDGILYMHDEVADEDIFCGRLDNDEDPVNLPACRVVRLESLSSDWYRRVYIPETGQFLTEDINVQMTLRSEERSGELYMYAYRRVFGKLHKRYVGRATEITQQRLLDVAKKLPAG